MTFCLPVVSFWDQVPVKFIHEACGRYPPRWSDIWTPHSSA